MSKTADVIRPKADQDLDHQAFHYATENPDIGHRFLVSAHETFALLATQPQMGWLPKLRDPALRTLRIFRVNGFDRILILYRALNAGIEVVRVIHGSRNL